MVWGSLPSFYERTHSMPHGLKVDRLGQAQNLWRKGSLQPSRPAREADLFFLFSLAVSQSLEEDPGYRSRVSTDELTRYIFDRRQISIHQEDKEKLSQQSLWTRPNAAVWADKAHRNLEVPRIGHGVHTILRNYRGRLKTSQCHSRYTYQVRLSEVWPWPLCIWSRVSLSMAKNLLEQQRENVNQLAVQLGALTRPADSSQ